MANSPNTSLRGSVLSIFHQLTYDKTIWKIIHDERAWLERNSSNGNIV